MEDHKIVSLIQEGLSSKAFQYLYKHFPMVRKMVISKGGKKEDAEDIYQEALIILCRKVKQTDFVLTSKLSTFLYSICALLWKEELKKRQKFEYVDFHIDMDRASEESILETMETEDRMRIAEKVIGSLGERCQELLTLFYMGSMKLKSIADQMGYSSENTAKNQKYKCLEAAKNMLKELKSKMQASMKTKI